MSVGKKNPPPFHTAGWAWAIVVRAIAQRPGTERTLVILEQQWLALCGVPRHKTLPDQPSTECESSAVLHMKLARRLLVRANGNPFFGPPLFQQLRSELILCAQYDTERSIRLGRKKKVREAVVRHSMLFAILYLRPSAETLHIIVSFVHAPSQHGFLVLFST